MPRLLALAGIVGVACGGRVSIDANVSPSAGGLPSSVQPSIGGTYAEGGHAPGAGTHSGGAPSVAGGVAIGGGENAATGGATGAGAAVGGGNAGEANCSTFNSTSLVCDTDGDGVPDALDQCLFSAEDGLGPLPKDGCPDGDADGIPDDRDACRSKREDGLPPKPTDGCPKQ